MMRVLLLSPLAGRDPICGDTVYTEELLSNPPLGVQYEDYESALRAGRLRELARRPAISRASGAGKLRESLSYAGARSVNAFRQMGVLFREPFRHFSVEPDAYDAIHCHAFSASFRKRPPLVVSSAAVLTDLY